MSKILGGSTPFHNTVTADPGTESNLTSDDRLGATEGQGATGQSSVGRNAVNDESNLNRSTGVGDLLSSDRKFASSGATGGQGLAQGGTQDFSDRAVGGNQNAGASESSAAGGISNTERDTATRGTTGNDPSSYSTGFTRDTSGTTGTDAGYRSSGFQRDTAGTTDTAGALGTGLAAGEGERGLGNERDNLGSGTTSGTQGVSSGNYGTSSTTDTSPGTARDTTSSSKSGGGILSSIKEAILGQKGQTSDTTDRGYTASRDAESSGHGGRNAAQSGAVGTALGAAAAAGEHEHRDATSGTTGTGTGTSGLGTHGTTAGRNDLSSTPGGFPGETSGLGTTGASTTSTARDESALDSTTGASTAGTTGQDELGTSERTTGIGRAGGREEVPSGKSTLTGAAAGGAAAAGASGLSNRDENSRNTDGGLGTTTGAANDTSLIDRAGGKTASGVRVPSELVRGIPTMSSIPQEESSATGTGRQDDSSFGRETAIGTAGAAGAAGLAGHEAEKDRQGLSGTDNNTTSGGRSDGLTGGTSSTRDTALDDTTGGSSLTGREDTSASDGRSNLYGTAPTSHSGLHGAQDPSTRTGTGDTSGINDTTGGAPAHDQTTGSSTLGQGSLGRDEQRLEQGGSTGLGGHGATSSTLGQGSLGRDEQRLEQGGSTGLGGNAPSSSAEQQSYQSR